MKVRKILLIRHGESLKNLRDEHGGKGDVLSEKGKRQCSKVSLFLHNEKMKKYETNLFYSSNPQVTETLKIIKKDNNFESICDDRLKGVNLGVLDGLSREDALKKFPNAAKRLEKWRACKLEIDKLDIPNAESASEFHKRIKSFIEDRIISNESRDIVIIGTTSTIIMIVNFFILGEKFNFKNYKNYNFYCGSITKLIFKGNKFIDMTISEEVSDLKKAL